MARREFVDANKLKGLVDETVENLERFRTRHQSLFNAYGDTEDPNPHYADIITATKAITAAQTTEDAKIMADTARNLLMGFNQNFSQFRNALKASNDSLDAANNLSSAIPGTIDHATRLEINNINDPSTNTLSAHFENFLKEDGFTPAFGGPARDLVLPNPSQVAAARTAFAAFDKSLTDTTLSPVQQMNVAYGAMRAEIVMSNDVPYRAGNSYEMSIHDGFIDTIRGRLNALKAAHPDLANLDPATITRMANLSAPSSPEGNVQPGAIPGPPAAAVQR